MWRRSSSNRLWAHALLFLTTMSLNLFTTLQQCLSRNEIMLSFCLTIFWKMCTDRYHNSLGVHWKIRWELKGLTHSSHLSPAQIGKFTHIILLPRRFGKVSFTVYGRWPLARGKVRMLFCTWILICSVSSQELNPRLCFKGHTRSINSLRFFKLYKI